MRGGVQRTSVAAFARLFGFQDETVPFGAIDPARRRLPIVVMKAERPLEAIVQIARAFVVRRGDADQAAELNDEGLIVGAFADRRSGPMFDEAFDIV